MMTTSKYSMIMIGDWGEEIDDETATYFLHSNTNKTVAYVCVDGAMSAYDRKFRLANMIPEVRNHIYTFDNFEKIELDNNKELVILQTAPIEDSVFDIVKNVVNNINNSNTYRFILQGDLGTTFNSKDGFKKAPEYFIKHASKYTSVVAPYPLYTYNNSQYFGKIISQNILMNAFKSMIGRAPSTPFTVHLIGNNGSNFKVTKNFYETVTQKSIYNLIPTNENIESAEIYCSNIDFNHNFAVKKMEQFNETVKGYKSNLALMLKCYEDLFGLDCLIYSNDLVFNHANWNETFLGEMFQKFTKHVKNSPNMQLTPAYDLKAAYVAAKDNNVDKITISQIMTKSNIYVIVYTIIILFIHLCLRSRFLK